MYTIPGVKDTLDIGAAANSYYSNLFPLNPGGIVARVPSAEDMGLLSDPKRGSLETSAMFHDRATTR